ncbi:MAG: Aspartate aminotransferase, partial [candidate division CPR2 bacterium GW2011_GWD1_39_7]
QANGLAWPSVAELCRKTGQDRKTVMTALDKLVANGIGTGIHYPVGINDQPLYKEMNCSAFKTPISKKVSSHVISIPVHPSLTKKELETIVKTVNSV